MTGNFRIFSATIFTLLSAYLLIGEITDSGLSPVSESYISYIIIVFPLILTLSITSDILAKRIINNKFGPSTRFISRSLILSSLMMAIMYSIYQLKNILLFYIILFSISLIINLPIYISERLISLRRESNKINH